MCGGGRGDFYEFTHHLPANQRRFLIHEGAIPTDSINKCAGDGHIPGPAVTFTPNTGAHYNYYVIMRLFYLFSMPIQAFIDFPGSYRVQLDNPRDRP